MATTYEIVSKPYEVKIYSASGSSSPVRIESYVKIKFVK